MSDTDKSELEDEITSIIYGANWKQQDIADAFKPDVKAVMKLIDQQCNQARISQTQKIIDGTSHWALPDTYKFWLDGEMIELQAQAKETEEV